MSKDVQKIRVHATWDAYTKMQALVKKFDFEVSWIMSVKNHGADELIIDKVFVIDQIGTGATTRFNQEAFDNFCMKVGMGEVEDVRMEDLRGWGHSHVNMNAYESSEDIDTSKRTFGSESSEYIISLVMNKRNEYYLAVYVFKPFKMVLGGELIVDYPSVANLTEFLTDAESKVKRNTPAYAGRGVVTYHNGARVNDDDKTAPLFYSDLVEKGKSPFKCKGKNAGWSEMVGSFKEMSKKESEMRAMEFSDDPEVIAEMMDYYDDMYKGPSNKKGGKK